MSKQYRLPEWLGGHEVNRLTDASHPGRINVTLNQGEGVILEIDLKDLTDLRPAEPPDNTNWLDQRGGVLIRRDNWPGSNGDNRWYLAGMGGPVTWAWIAERLEGELRELTEDQALGLTAYGPFAVEYDRDSNKIVVKHARLGFIAAYAPNAPVSLAVIHADIAKDREVFAQDYKRSADKAQGRATGGIVDIKQLYQVGQSGCVIEVGREEKP